MFILSLVEKREVKRNYDVIIFSQDCNKHIFYVRCSGITNAVVSLIVLVNSFDTHIKHYKKEKIYEMKYMPNDGKNMHQLGHIKESNDGNDTSLNF